MVCRDVVTVRYVGYIHIVCCMICRDLPIVCCTMLRDSPTVYTMVYCTIWYAGRPYCIPVTYISDVSHIGHCVYV